MTLTRYPFLAVNPATTPGADALAYVVLDCPSVHTFARRWAQVPFALQAEFNFDLPVLTDDHERPVGGAKLERHWGGTVTDVRAVMFDAYVELVRAQVNAR